MLTRSGVGTWLRYARVVAGAAVSPSVPEQR